MPPTPNGNAQSTPFYSDVPQTNASSVLQNTKIPSPQMLPCDLLNQADYNVPHSYAAQVGNIGMHAL